MAKVSVKDGILRWAIERSGASMDSLRVRFPKLQDWLDGSGEPTLRQLEELSQATSTPLGWFFLDLPIKEELPFPFFRTVSDHLVRRASADLLETIYIVQRRQEWIREYFVKEAHSPLPFVNSVRADAPATEIAVRMRMILGLDDNWASRSSDWTKALTQLRQAMEAVGIFVVISGVVGSNNNRTLNPSEFRGFVLVDDYAPFVFVNGADFKAAQMFTLAHELAHVFLGKSAAFDLQGLQPAENSTERICNEAAAEFLVPQKRLRELWPNVRNSSTRFNDLSATFKVSRIVIARRALDLGLITKKAFSEFYRISVPSKRKKTKGGGSFYLALPSRIGERFGRAVIQALRDGLIQYTEAYSLTGLNRKTFDRFAEGIE